MIHLFHSFIWCFLLLNPTISNAQKQTEYKKIGESQFANKRWQEALQAFYHYQDSKPGDFNVITKIGICLYHLNQTEQAKKYLDYVLTNNPHSTDPYLFYYRARLAHSTANYDQAISCYKRFIKFSGTKDILRPGIPDQIRRCLSGKELFTNSTIALIENLGNKVNSEGDEFAPVFSPNYNDRFYFAAIGKDSNGGYRNDQGFEDEVAGHYCSDIIVAQQDLEGWMRTGKLSALLNTTRYEIPLCFNNNGSAIIYYRGFTPYGGHLLVDTAGKKDEYRIDPPAFQSPMDPASGDFYPTLVNDTLLLYSARMSDGFGGYDLYFTTKNDTGWTNPRNLGPSINSPYDEICPFLCNDGRTLFFSSNNTASIGGFDVFSAQFNPKESSWSQATSAGYPINSPGDDTWFKLTQDGNNAILASNRTGGFGQNDLWMVYFTKPLPEQNPETTTQLFSHISGNRPTEITHYTLPTLEYDSDTDLLSGENLKTIQKAAQIGILFPSVTTFVTIHTNESLPTKFELYNGIKRAELVGKMLTEAGASSKNILLRCVGSNFPRAKNVIEANPNPIGQKLNRRVTIHFEKRLGDLPFKLTITQPEIPTTMQNTASEKFDSINQTVYFKVDFAKTRQFMNNETLLSFPNPIIESTYGSGEYQYSVGLFTQYQDAARLYAEIAPLNPQIAVINAYVKGLLISKAEAIALLKKYPALAPFIKG